MLIASVAVNAFLLLEQDDKNLTKTRETLSWKDSSPGPWSSLLSL